MALRARAAANKSSYEDGIIPFGIQHLKLAVLVLAPEGETIVSK